MTRPTTPKTFETPKTFQTPIPQRARPGEKLVPDPIDPPEKSATDQSETETRVNKPVVELLDPAPSLPVQSPSLKLDDKTSDDKQTDTIGTPSQSTGRFEALPAPNEPPLNLEVTNPKRRPLGSMASFDVLVTNTSEQTLENVLVDVDFDDELSFPGRGEKRFRKSLGILRPGQSRDMRLTLRGDRAGLPACRFEVTADGMSPVKHETKVEFGEPTLMMKLIGPPRRTVGSRAEFTVRIANISSQPMNDVQVTLHHDGAFLPREATSGYQLDKSDIEKHQIRWSLGRLAAGAGVQVQADFDCKQIAEQACVSVQVKSDDTLIDEADRCVTVVSIPGDIELDVSDESEPTRVGGEVTFDVRVKNRAVQGLTDLRLELLPSEQLRLTGVTATLNDKTVLLSESKANGSWKLTLPDSLPPDDVLHLVVRATGVEPGDAELKVIVVPGADGQPIESSEFTVINP